MDGRKDAAVEALLEHLIGHGPGDGATVFGRSVELAVQMEREPLLRAVMLSVAEMHIKGVSTREVEAAMREFGIDSLSSTQASRAAKLLDDELAGC